MSRKGKGGHGTGMTTRRTGGSGRTTCAQSEGKAKYGRTIDQVNRTNKAEFLRMRRLRLALDPQIKEYKQLATLMEDVLTGRITAEEAETRAGGRSPLEVIQRLAALAEEILPLRRGFANVKQDINRPLGRVARAERLLKLSKDGNSVNPRKESHPLPDAPEPEGG